jgi:hypothetical protein
MDGDFSGAILEIHSTRCERKVRQQTMRSARSSYWTASRAPQAAQRTSWLPAMWMIWWSYGGGGWRCSGGAIKGRMSRVVGVVWGAAYRLLKKMRKRAVDSSKKARRVLRQTIVPRGTQSPPVESSCAKGSEQTAVAGRWRLTKNQRQAHPEKRPLYLRRRAAQSTWEQPLIGCLIPRGGSSRPPQHRPPSTSPPSSQHTSPRLHTTRRAPGRSSSTITPANAAARTRLRVASCCYSCVRY